MSYSNSVGVVPRENQSNIVLARMVKDEKDLLMTDADLKVLLQLRRNRMRIGNLTQDLFDGEFEMQDDPSAEEEVIENLQMINGILDNVRAALKEL